MRRGKFPLNLLIGGGLIASVGSRRKEENDDQTQRAEGRTQGDTHGPSVSLVYGKKPCPVAKSDPNKYANHRQALSDCGQHRLKWAADIGEPGLFLTALGVFYPENRIG